MFKLEIHWSLSMDNRSDYFWRHKLIKIPLPSSEWFSNKLMWDHCWLAVCFAAKCAVTVVQELLGDVICLEWAVLSQCVFCQGSSACILCLVVGWCSQFVWLAFISALTHSVYLRRRMCPGLCFGLGRWKIVVGSHVGAKPAFKWVFWNFAEQSGSFFLEDWEGEVNHDHSYL